MGKFDQKKYDNAKDTAAKFFDKNKRLPTASLGEIALNSDGFMHLIWKVLDKHKRDWKNQIKRFHLLPYIKPVLGGMKYYQEYSESLETVRVKRMGKVVMESKLVRYYGFVAIIENKIRIKIILKKVGEGNVHFWSVIPFWETKDYKGVRVISIHKGNPKED